jgi:hypothetical protein
MTTAISIAPLPLRTPFTPEATVRSESKAAGATDSDRILESLAFATKQTPPLDGKLVTGNPLSPPTSSTTMQATEVAISLQALTIDSDVDDASQAVQLALFAVAREMPLGQSTDTRTAVRVALSTAIADVRAQINGNDLASEHVALLDDIDAIEEQLRNDDTTRIVESKERTGVNLSVDPIFALLIAIMHLQLKLTNASRESSNFNTRMQVSANSASAAAIVSASYKNLWGSVGAALVGTGVSALGTAKQLQGHSSVRANVRTDVTGSNVRNKVATGGKATVDRTEGTKINEAPRSSATEVGRDAHGIEVVKAPIPDHAPAHNAVEVSDHMATAQVGATTLSTDSQISQMKANDRIATGQAVTGMAVVVSRTLDSGFDFAAATDRRQEIEWRTSADVSGKTASQDSEQASKHYEVVNKTMDLVNEIARQQNEVGSTVANNTAA